MPVTFYIPKLEMTLETPRGLNISDTYTFIVTKGNELKSSLTFDELTVSGPTKAKYCFYVKNIVQ